MSMWTMGRIDLGMAIRGALLLCAAGVLAVLCGWIARSHYGLTAVAVLVVVPVVIFLLPRPFAACMLLLALLASALSYTVLPRIHLAGGSPINLGDVLLVATVGGTLWRKPWRVWPPPVRRFYVALAAMLLLALIPTAMLAVEGHAQAGDALFGYKNLLYIAVALTVALELSGRLWWPLVNAAILLSTIVSVLSLLALASGSIGHLLNSVNPQAVTSAVGVDPQAVSSLVGSTPRIRLVGLFLVYAMTIPTFVMVLLVKDRWRPLRVIALLLMVAAIGVSLNRNMYFAGAAGLVITLLVGGPRLRYRFLISAITIAAIVTLLVQSTAVPRVTAEVSTRAQSALSTQVLSTASLQTRQDEFSHALNSIAQHPLTGVGWGQNYGAYFNGTAPRSISGLTPGAPFTYVEDLYLDLATYLGIPVALAFLLVPAIPLAYGIKRARWASAPLDRAMVGAGVGTVVALLLSCVVGTYVQDPGSTTAFGFACGFLLAAGLRAGFARDAPAHQPPAVGDT